MGTIISGICKQEMFCGQESYQQEIDFHEALDQFIKDYRDPDFLTMDGAPEKVEKNSKIKAIMRKRKHPKEDHQTK